MKVVVHAVGRMKAGPERDLAGRYFDRFGKAGPQVGLEWGGVTEIAESATQSAADRRREEAERLSVRLGAGCALLLLDERGRNLGSAELANWFAGVRDNGTRTLYAAIGGPDGHDDSLRRRADLVLGFGSLTWPHQMARIMLAEQLYRCVTILTGHPYHRA